MVDQKKRTTLKTMSAAAAVSAFPPVLSAAGLTDPLSTVTEEALAPLTGRGLDIEIEPANELTPAWLRISNESNETVTLKHVSPGVVTSDGETFDINAALIDDVLVINPDESYSFMIEPMAPGAKPVPVPSSVISPETVSVTTRYNLFEGHDTVTTQRMMLS